MKHLFFSIIALFLVSSTAVAQGDITPKVSDALKRGDAASLASFFSPQIDLTLNGEDGSYSAADAQRKLAAFFSQNTAQNFTVKHQGTSKLDDQYRIGDLTTAKGVFRVTFFMKKSGSSMQIKQIKIE